MLAPTCRHCSAKPVSRPRGLCKRCFYTDGVRDLYPSTSKYAHRGEGNGFRTPPLPDPTEAAPGSPEKLAVLAERAKRKLGLWHPHDGWLVSTLTHSTTTTRG